jgi:hypothetical protein
MLIHQSTPFYNVLVVHSTAQRAASRSLLSTHSLLPCVFDNKIGMKKYSKISGTELKVQIEKVFATQELRAARNYTANMLSRDDAQFPCGMEGIIIERIRNAGVDLKKHGYWYDHVAAYALLPQMEKIIMLERKYGNPPGSGKFDDEKIKEKWFNLIDQSLSITYLELNAEFKDITRLKL